MIERPYQPTDLPAVMEIYTASIHSLAAPYYSPEQILAWAPGAPVAVRWEERLSQVHTIVAESDGVLAGFASYTDEGYLDLFFIHPAFARQGVGSNLYRQIESTLRAAGVGHVTTDASLAAREFFEHHGFQVDVEESVEVRGVFLRRFAMYKQLQGNSTAPV